MIVIRILIRCVEFFLPVLLVKYYCRNYSKQYGGSVRLATREEKEEASTIESQIRW